MRFSSSRESDKILFSYKHKVHLGQYLRENTFPLVDNPVLRAVLVSWCVCVCVSLGTLIGYLGIK